MQIISQETLENGDVRLNLTQGSIVVPLINPLDNRDHQTRIQYQIDLLNQTD